MAQKSLQNNEDLARKIKLRRCELNLTIEEAALRAGVGTKTWCRYEAGEAIRMDKCKGICKALNWRGIPGHNDDDDEMAFAREYKAHEAWSRFLEHEFGVGAALSFAAGSDILLDHIEEDMEGLASMSADAHIGQLAVSWIRDSMPEQFLTRYDYEFLHRMKCSLSALRMRAKSGFPMTAHSVIEELILYLCCEEASGFIELSRGTDVPEDDTTVDFNEWIFDLFDDMDLISFLYSDVHLETDHPYHFAHWPEQQFYTD